jgi:hypothetical protein
MNERSVVRYIVAPHQNRGGGISHRCWDVRVITRDEFGIEHDGGKIVTKQTRREAQAFAARKNRRIK